jgi:hypothetical protein
MKINEQTLHQATLTNTISDLPRTLRQHSKHSYIPLEIAWAHFNFRKYFHASTLFTIFKMKSFADILSNLPLISTLSPCCLRFNSTL